MAVNLADGNLFVSMLLYPVVAMSAAFAAGARAFALLIFIAAFPIGYWYVMVTRAAFYWILRRLGKLLTGKYPEEYEPDPKDDQIGRVLLSWIVGMPLLLLYVGGPLAIIFAGIEGTRFSTSWIVTHLSVLRH
jgi:hypothetical protein